MRKIFLFAFYIVVLSACNDAKKDEPASTATTASATTDDKKNGDEILPMSEADASKEGMIAFAKGDIDGMTANYDDNIIYKWSSGDSLNGKKAVADYYKGRWALIDSFSYSQQVVLPIMVRVQQAEAQRPGKWVLTWSFAHVKYKNGKKLDFWVHNVNHYNDAGKVDYVGQYLDRHPIIEATK